jgi:hypothetical protein
LQKATLLVGDPIELKDLPKHFEEVKQKIIESFKK